MNDRMNDGMNAGMNAGTDASMDTDVKVGANAVPPDREPPHQVPADLTLHCEFAWLGGDTAAADVVVEITAGEIRSVTAGVEAPVGATRLPGLTMPGLVNSHSHVFHRAIRGHAQSGVTDFWAWREIMYRVAGRLDPDLLYRLARATYGEMALSGITCVGEFFYVHHDPDGVPYASPNVMGDAVVAAARDAGIRITLLDTCYLQADVAGSELSGVQRRFGDDDWERWAARVQRLSDTDGCRVGAAIHSVRAVPRRAMEPIARFSRDRGMPLHVHVSEQPAENLACVRATGSTPVELLAAEGVLGAGTTAVHATHLTDSDIEALGASGTSIAMCATTERDLADGVGPAARLAAAGSPLCVGSDAHMMIDLWEEGRAIELDERLITGRRGHHHARGIAAALTGGGAGSLGWNAGRIAAGGLADLVTVRLDSPRTAGARWGDPLAHVLFAATGSDVDTVIAGGRTIVSGGRHASITDVGEDLQRAIRLALA